ncbi:hypothetical protein CTAYLR_006582 [Chrysophaeum taylorii]|uniref:WW domain-containing protein n=1 Tax=Chrysophaeum taylorii TaxID=2483200 RepID=A0AAD7UMY3_9STRA|nr:hypothetical protein CTAYLR_006582 [Chrysophaeum taylorii]
MAPPKPEVVLPLGWECLLSAKFDTWYYHHKESGKSQWVPPEIEEKGDESSSPPLKKAKGGSGDFAAPGPHGGAIHEPSPLEPLRIVAKHPEPSHKSVWFCTELMPNEIIREIYRTERVRDAAGNEHKFRDGVNPAEGMHIYNCVRTNSLTSTLEVGCAMGTSALYICQAMKDGAGGVHVAIDPNQDTQYKSIARANISRAGLDDHFELIRETSYAAMPHLLRNGRKFHLIFIDGWHTFDYTLMDFFFADLLLQVNGLILLDDINHKGVQKCLKYVRTNWPHYEYVADTPAAATMATFRKLSHDKRDWNAHVNF